MARGHSELVDFLQDLPGTNTRARTQDRDAFLRAITALYAQIREWLEPAVAQRLALVLDAGGVEISEPGVDVYSAPSLIVDLRGHRIRFIPRGFSVRGAKGRVDVDAGERIGMLVLKAGHWNFARRKPKHELFRLTQETFTEAIKELLGG